MSWLVFGVGVGVVLLTTTWLRIRRGGGRRRNATSPLSVLVIGASKGLGRKVAELLVGKGHAVVITSSKGEEESIATSLRCVGGVAMDVKDYGGVEAGMQLASDKLGGTIDVVIAMQAVTQRKTGPFQNTPTEEMEDIVRTNLLGSMYAARAALRMGGKVKHVVFVGGGGTSGAKTPLYASYGTTKSCFPQLMASLVSEQKQAQHSTGIHVITPGMTLTSLLMGGDDCSTKDPHTRRIFNVLAETPTVMAHWFVERVEALQGTGTMSSYLTPLGVAWRFLRYPLMKNRLINEETGQLITVPL